ncbi:hypothetical protein Tco_1090138 [Tanacetum coccineum]|uniref:Uncharacterized protein n=1 Tax=Tanacetum coccineum TaxID=301880 RepID=A0ABQ5I4R1_9ASTR
MNPVVSQQTAIDNALVAPDDRVNIRKCNMRINPSKKPQKEPTYQVVLDSLALSHCYHAFLIAAEVSKIYMQQFWFTISKIKDSSSYQFKLDKKKCRIDVEVFRYILQICPKLHNQEFDEPPSDEEIVSFIKELGYKGDIGSDTEVHTDHMHQPWRTFVVIINKCLSGKTTVMMNQKLQNSNSYKTYLAFATGAATPKKARKWKKPDSPSKKQTLVITEEPAKKPAARSQPTGVQIRDDPGVSVSNKKTPARAERNKGIVLMYEATLLEETQMKKAIKRSKRETHMHQAGGSGDGAGLEPEVPDEPKGKSIDTHEGTGVSDDDDDDQQGDDERTEFDDDKSVDLNKTDDDEEDEFVHTPDNYVPTDEETNDVDEEEYKKINEEMYDDVNVELKDAELDDEDKGDVEMTDVAQVTNEQTHEQIVVVNEEINPEAESTQVQHIAQATTTSALATQNATTGAPPSSSSHSVSSNYGSIFLNLESIQSTKTEIISILSDFENEVKTLGNVDHNLAIHAAIKSKVPTVVKEHLGTSLDDALHKVIQRHTAELIKEQSVPADVVEVLQQQQKPQKSIADIRKIKMEQAGKQQGTKYTITSSDKAALSISCSHGVNLEDEDAMDKGVADKLKKRKQDDADKDEGPPAGSDQGLKRRKMMETVFKAGDTQVLQDLGEDIVDSKPTQKWLSDLAKAEKSSKTFDELMSTPIDFTAFAMNNMQISDLTKADLGIEDTVPTLWSPVKVAYDRHAAFGTSHWGPKKQRFYRYATKKVLKHDVYSTKRIIVVTNVKVNKWYGYGHLEDIEVQRSDQNLYKFMESDFPRLHLNDVEDMLLLVVQNRLFNLNGDVIVHLAASLRMYTRRIVIQKRVEDLQLVSKATRRSSTSQDH